MIQGYVLPLCNHLWQSTLFAAIAGLLTLLLRDNRPQARYWLWISASLKFLIPFSLLVGFGTYLGPSGRAAHASALTRPPSPGLTEQVFISTVRTVAVSASESRNASPLPALLALAWACGLTVVLFFWWRAWWRIRAAAKAARPLRLGTRVQAISSPAILEPAVFGIWRPVLMLPEGITDRLTAGQLEAIVAHELCHVRRRDNLFAAVHMAVESVLWFHPLVWWLGRRIVEERERACDEEVLRLGSTPRVYAEGILKVCEFYLESPLACASGVTGSNLRKRIGAIMTHRDAQKLELRKKLVLATAAIAVVASPIIFGIVNAPQLRAQSQPATPLAFEVASVKPNKSQDRRPRWQNLPGGRFSAANVPLHIIIAMAYNVPFQSERLSGGPDWVRSERYDIEAKAPDGWNPDGSTAKVRDEKMRLMLQTLLADRFKLALRRETKELPVYALVVSKRGAKLQKSKIEEQDCPEVSGDNAVSCHSFRGGQGRGLHAEAVDMSDLVLFISNWTDRPTIDKTGIKGLFAIETDGWAPMRPRQGPPGDGPEAQTLSDPSRPTLFMIMEQLGLKLESQKAPVEMFVIEHVEKPSEN